MTLPSVVEDYRRKRAVAGPWRLAGEERRDFHGAIVIPALAEAAALFATLDSLRANPPALRARFLTIVVVNHGAGAASEIVRDNLHTLHLLREMASTDLPLAWVDAASPGLELPAANVGLARRIGFDLALDRLQWGERAPLLISLDADTLVRPDYLPALHRHFRSARDGGAVIPFCHQRGETAAQEEAIVLYELYMRSYALGLARAGSPYRFSALGSALACRADAYVRCGGMPRRAAAEDFYFLQQLVKTAGVIELAGTVVHPSARISCRTPLGTGRAIERLLAGDDGAVFFLPVACYRLLADWLALACRMWQEPPAVLAAAARELDATLGAFVAEERLTEIWPRLQRQYRTEATFMTAFHRWFDGLKTRQLLYRLSRGPFPAAPASVALPSLLTWGGLPAAADPKTQLALLRGCGEGCVCRKKCHILKVNCRIKDEVR